MLQSRFYRLFSWLALAGLAVVAVGCGQSDHVQRLPVVPVQGQVSFQNEPISGALVVFHPSPLVEPAPPPARAIVQDDGKFTLTTYDANDGAVPGEYKVTIEWRKLVDEGGDVKAGPNLLPERYAHLDSTDLVVKVAEGSNQLPPLQIQR